MSASRVQPGGESYKQLTLLKQKVKRGQSASDATNLDNLREEVSPFALTSFVIINKRFICIIFRVLINCIRTKS